MPEGTFTTSDGCTIGYTLHSAGHAGAPRIALIHSLALDRSFWDGVIVDFHGHAHILAHDCRGHGRSERRAGTYTTNLFARDLAELLTHVQWDAAHIAGCSMGGCVAQSFAALYPQRALSACLMDTTAWYGPGAPKEWRERAGAARSKGMAALVEFQSTRWVSDAFRVSHKDVLDRLVAVFLKNDIDCYQSTCEMLGDADLRAQAAAIAAPVAVVVGEEDYATPVAMAEWLHQSIPHSSLTVIPRARHLTPVECPREIAASIRKLIEASGPMRY